MATTSLKPGQQRLTPEVPRLRSLQPYLNYEAPNLTSHAHPGPASEMPKDWSGRQGYGARHRFDSAPFTLWDACLNDFRQSTDIESRWMIKKFSATAIAFHFPILIIETSVPPKPLPLTVAGVATRFVPPPAVGDTSSAPRGGQEGLCGAPIVVDDESDEGRVAGFVQVANDSFLFSPCLDELVHQGWSVV
ncbi:hypothetical protein Q9189_005169 [Teloschistes chrysophthalmus]